MAPLVIGLVTHLKSRKRIAILIGALAIGPEPGLGQTPGVMA